jgi:chromosome segregation ATPase
MSKQSKTPHELTKDVALLHRAVSNLDSRVSNLTGSTGRDLTQLSGLYNDLEAKADQALAVGNGCHQQIADLNRALVSTVAKADESLKSGAVALRSITECETEQDRMDKRIDMLSAKTGCFERDIASLVNRSANLERSISDEGQVRRNVEGITNAKISEINTRINTQRERLSAVEDKVASLSNCNVDWDRHWQALNTQIARVAADRRNKHEAHRLDMKNDIDCLRAAVENLAKQVGKANVAIIPPPDPVAFPIRFTAVVLFKGGTLAAKTGFPTVEGAMTWFKGYQARAAEHHRCDAKLYTCIVANEVD